MNYLHKTLAGALVLGVAAAATPAAAFPDKPIEFVIPFGAGGGADIEGRLLAKEMSKVLGVPVTPVNRPGGGGAVTYTHVKNAKPDGYTVAWNSTSVLTTTNLGNTDFTYEALDHVGRVEFQPQPFAIRADAKWKTFADFVADCTPPRDAADRRLAEGSARGRPGGECRAAMPWDANVIRSVKI